MRLLVIDDSATIRKLVEISFRGSPWELEFAGTGARGISQAHESGPQVILLDYVLPDMKATEVCRRLAADERCAQIPVLLMSAKTELGNEDLRRMGRVMGFVAKPFSGEELVTRVNALGGTAAAAPAPLPAPRSPGRFSFKQKET